MAKSKKQSHTQRLVDSMKTLGTARTPISNTYKSGKDRNILPKSILDEGKGTRRQRTTGRVLIPQKLHRPNRPNAVSDPGTPTPSASYLSANRVQSYSGKGWNTNHPRYNVERSAYDLATARYMEYGRALNSVIQAEIADDNRNRQRKVAKTKATSRRIGSRGGLGRSGGLRGGSRS